MKRIVVIAIWCFAIPSLFAGGLVTNTNQSASFTRMMWRDAVLGIDGVYYNPAGLTRFEEGFYFSLNNQTIGQKQIIRNNYTYLTDSLFDYTGDVFAPIFPSAYVAYKIGDIVISGGFMPIGGGGSAEFADGLPSFETRIAELVPLLSSEISLIDQSIIEATGGAVDPGFRNIGGYNSNIYFKGRSIYYGYQANISYPVSDYVSLAIGARLVTAKNTYKGYVKDVEIDAPDQWGGTQTPGEYLRFLANTSLIGPESQIGMMILEKANQVDAQTNLEADVIRKGNGVTPILSLNVVPNEQLSLSMKYEFRTKLELGTTINDGKDAGGLFTQDAVVADMPALLVVGATFNPNEELMLTTGFHYYFDKSNDYDGSINRDVVMIDNNLMEYGLGFDYAVNDILNLSAGWLGVRTGVNDLYQNDQRFSLHSNTVGGGLGLKIIDEMDLDLGASYTFYQDGFRGYTHALGGQSIAITENYSKSAWVVSLGLNFYFEY